MSQDTDVQMQQAEEATGADPFATPAEDTLVDPLAEDDGAISDPLGEGGEAVQANQKGRRQGSGPKVDDDFRGLEQVLVELDPESAAS